MSDPKIVLSNPPVEPFDVPIVLDDPPVEPFDVPTFPSSPPIEPFDVSVNIDPPPIEPFDVPISFDGPPRVPEDVPILLDSPPREPTDVPIVFSGPPIDPVDVPIVLSRPPAEPHDVITRFSDPPKLPFDVPIVLDAPPAIPIDVPIVLDAPPVLPVDVPIVLSPSPGEPLDVPITLSPPPAEPFDVPTFPSLPNVQPFGDGRSPPTFDQIVEAVGRFDGQLSNFLSGLIGIETISPSFQGGAALNPQALANWFKNYIDSVGAGGVARFIAEQTTLYAMNPTVARVFDPFYFVKISSPGSMGNLTTTIDTGAGITMREIARAENALIEAKVFASPDVVVGDNEPNLYGPTSTYLDGQAVTVDSIVDSPLDDIGLSASPFAKVVDGVTKFDSISFFESRGPTGASSLSSAARLRARSGQDNVSNTKLARSAAIGGVIPVKFPGEEDDGSVLSEGQDPSDVVDDDDARIPLSFTDLRQIPGQRYRSVFFRPENLQFGKVLSPEFGDAGTFGRVDPVVGYQKTSRTVNMSFDVLAFCPEDLELMYQKMVWLESMCYPSYGFDGLMTSGPVVRVRIGDVVATNEGGVPGVIKSLNFDFADAIWELRKNFKVPLSYKVSLDMLILHDGAVGSVNGVFGTFRLPAARSRNTAGTNLASPNNGSTEDEGLSLIPRGFARFGEPRRS